MTNNQETTTVFVERAEGLRTRLYDIVSDLDKLQKDLGYNIYGWVSKGICIDSGKWNIDAYIIPVLLSLADSIPKMRKKPE